MNMIKSYRIADDVTSEPKSKRLTWRRGFRRRLLTLTIIPSTPMLIVCGALHLPIIWCGTTLAIYICGVFFVLFDRLPPTSKRWSGIDWPTSAELIIAWPFHIIRRIWRWLLTGE